VIFFGFFITTVLATGWRACSWRLSPEFQPRNGNLVCARWVNPQRRASNIIPVLALEIRHKSRTKTTEKTKNEHPLAFKMRTICSCSANFLAKKIFGH
jgi:hypothetical protein